MLERLKKLFGLEEKSFENQNEEITKEPSETEKELQEKEELLKKINKTLLDIGPLIALTYYSASLSLADIFKLNNLIEELTKEARKIDKETDEIIEILENGATRHIEIKENVKQIKDELEELVQKITYATGGLERINTLASTFESYYNDFFNGISKIQEFPSKFFDMTAKVNEIINDIIMLTQEEDPQKLKENLNAISSKLNEDGNSLVSSLAGVSSELEEFSQNSIKALSEIKPYIENMYTYSQQFNIAFDSIKKFTESVKLKTELVLNNLYASDVLVAEEMGEIINITYNIKDIGKGIETLEAVPLEIEQNSRDVILRNTEIWDTYKDIGDKHYVLVIEKMIDHAKFMRDVLEFVSGRIDYKVVDYTECKLGKWYYSEGAKQILEINPKAYESFKEIEEPHKNYHFIAKEIERMVRTKEKKELIVEKTYDLVASSRDIVYAIYKLSQDIRKAD